MKVIFLEIDGVLNYYDELDPSVDVPAEDRVYSFYINSPVAYISREKALLFGEFVKRHPEIQICIASSWRLYYPSLEILKEDFKHMGLPSANVIGVTPQSGSYRYMEVAEWIQDIKPTHYAILDDICDMGALQQHLVWTDSRVGLTNVDLIQIHQLLEL